MDQKPIPYLFFGGLYLFCGWCGFRQRKYHLERIFGNEKEPFLVCCDEYLERTIIGYNAWYFNEEGEPSVGITNRRMQINSSADPVVFVLPLGGWWNRPRLRLRGDSLMIKNFRIRSFSLDTQSVAIDDRQGSVHVMGIYDAITTLNKYGVAQGNTSWRTIFEAMHEEKEKLQRARDALVREIKLKAEQNAELAEERDASLREHKATRNQLAEVVADRNARVRTVEEVARSLDEVITHIERTDRLRNTKDGRPLFKMLLTMGIAILVKDDRPRLRYELMLEGLKRKLARR
ncbi:MAG: hypothetical protein Q7S52_05740 [bacterium]|nr:hypothetical protein [bacterium]